MPDVDEIELSLADAYRSGDKPMVDRLNQMLSIRQKDLPTKERVDQGDRFAAPTLPMRAAKDTAQGLIEGTYGLARELGPAGPIGPVPQMLVPDAVRDKLKSFMPQTSDINKLLGIDVPPPADVAERYTDSAFKFGGGMLPGPAAKAGSMYGPIMKWLAPLAKREMTGLAVGGIGQGAREISGQNQDADIKGVKYMPRPDIAGSTAEILAGILPAMLMRRPSNVTRTLNPVTKDLPEDVIRDMAEKRDRAQAFLGKPVLLSQAAEQAGPLSGLNQKLATSEGGLKAQQMYAEQLAAAMGKARQFAESPSSLATGFAEENRVMQAGKEAIGAPAKERTLATRPLYDLAKKEPFNVKEIDNIISDLEAGRITESMLENSTAGKAIIGHIKKLRGAQEEGASRMISSSDIGRLSKEAKTKQESLYAAGKNKSAAKAHEMVGEIIDARLQNYPAWQTAQDEFARLSGPVQAMNVSPMQNAFPQAARNSGRGNWTAGEQFLLDQRHEADSVREVARVLKTQDPEAFPLMVKKTWTDALDTASSKVGGINPELAPGTFANVIAGSKGSKMREKFHATVGELGMDKATADRMIEAFETISTGREGVGQIDPQWLAHAAGGNPISMVAQTPGLIVGGSPAANAVRRAVDRKTMERIVELFTEPKWVDEVVRISKYAQSKRDFQTALVGIMGYAGAHGGGPQQPKPEEIAGQLFK